jgi:hypothetical protein
MKNWIPKESPTRQNCKMLQARLCNSLVILLWLLLPRDHFVSRFFVIFFWSFWIIDDRTIKCWELIYCNTVIAVLLHHYFSVVCLSVRPSVTKLFRTTQKQLMQFHPNFTGMISTKSNFGCYVETRLWTLMFRSPFFADYRIGIYGINETVNSYLEFNKCYLTL